MLCSYTPVVGPAALIFTNFKIIIIKNKVFFRKQLLYIIIIIITSDLIKLQERKFKNM